VTDTDCLGCALNLDHCHGTLVVHADGAVDCTEPDCDDVDKARHTLVIDCDDTMVDCGCARFTPRIAVHAC
jgi:hypothetical protein